MRGGVKGGRRRCKRGLGWEKTGRRRRRCERGMGWQKRGREGGDMEVVANESNKTDRSLMLQ